MSLAQRQANQYSVHPALLNPALLGCGGGVASGGMQFGQSGPGACAGQPLMLGQPGLALGQAGQASHQLAQSFGQQPAQQLIPQQLIPQQQQGQLQHQAQLPQQQQQQQQALLPLQLPAQLMAMHHAGGQQLLHPSLAAWLPQQVQQVATSAPGSGQAGAAGTTQLPSAQLSPTSTYAAAKACRCFAHYCVTLCLCILQGVHVTLGAQVDPVTHATAKSKAQASGWQALCG